MRTRVGYAGGTTAAPTYRSIGDHMEAIEIDFDPKRISFRELLEVFWMSHDATRKAMRRQYASAIFVRDAADRAVAEASAAEAADAAGKLATEILPFERFTLAEDYHQKYRLRSVAWLDGVYRSVYPDLDAYVNSTATMRLNAWLDGEGAPTPAELGELGLDARETASLKSLLRL